MAHPVNDSYSPDCSPFEQPEAWLYPVFFQHSEEWSSEEASAQGLNLISNTILTIMHKMLKQYDKYFKGLWRDWQKQKYQKIQSLEVDRNLMHHWLNSSESRCTAPG